MTYFKNINSLADLKKQYRKLALELHPDRGGDAEKFKEMGNEFSLLYAVWQNRKGEDGTIRDENRTTETHNDFTSAFYHEQGWTGSNRYKYGYDHARIVKDVREYAKLRFPQFTFAINQDNRGVGVRSINVYLMQSPYKVCPDDEDGKIYAGERVNSYYRYDYSDFTPELREALFDVWDYLQTFNYDHSEAQFDHFDRGFYGSLYIGKYDKPYKVEVNRRFRTGGNAPAEFKWKDGPAHAAIKNAMGGNEWVYKTRYDRATDSDIELVADGLFLGTIRFYCNERSSYPNHYSQPSVQSRIIERLKGAGVLVQRVGGCIKFVGYTPETEAALAAEDKAREAAYKAFMGGQKAPKSESPKVAETIVKGACADITIEDYSEKAIAVFGNTKPYAERLKELGGKFNRNLRGRAGWIFSKRREGSVRELLRGVA